MSFETQLKVVIGLFGLIMVVALIWELNKFQCDQKNKLGRLFEHKDRD